LGYWQSSSGQLGGSTVKSLLDAVRQRGTKQTEFNHGIMTADRYVSTLQETIGLDNCYKFAATQTKSFADCLQQSKSTLVHSNQDMQVTKSMTIADAAKEYSFDVPKNTLMVFKHVLTTPRIDRDGDILRTEGASPDPKMLLLWQHVHNLPIGKALYVEEHTKDRLVMVSAIVDMNELSHDAAVMVDNDMARFSHGFRALDWEELVDDDDVKTGGFNIKSFEIMEESIVSVPSNVDAEMSERMVELCEKGTLKSQVVTEYAKNIRQEMPIQVAVEAEFTEDENEQVDDAADEKAIGDGIVSEEAKDSGNGCSECECSNCCGERANEAKDEHGDEEDSEDSEKEIADEQVEEKNPFAEEEEEESSDDEKEVDEEESDDDEEYKSVEADSKLSQNTYQQLKAVYDDLEAVKSAVCKTDSSGQPVCDLGTGEFATLERACNLLYAVLEQTVDETEYVTNFTIQDAKALLFQSSPEDLKQVADVLAVLLQEDKSLIVRAFKNFL